MKKEVRSLILGIILIVALVGYAYQLITGGIDTNTSLVFMMQLLIAYLLLEKRN